MRKILTYGIKGEKNWMQQMSKVSWRLWGDQMSLEKVGQLSEIQLAQDDKAISYSVPELSQRQ